MKYLMTFMYDGTLFNGYQKQKNRRTIQGELEKALTKINSNEKVLLSASGRTDSKVHAYNQKAHFTLKKELDPDALVFSLNKLLPDDIYVKKIVKVSDDFHARFNVKKKEYIYKINMASYDPFFRNYIYQYGKPLDVERMKKASKYLIGTHNFKAFTKNSDEKENYERTIFSIDFIVQDNILIIKFIGNGFLRYMVRNIVGTLIEIGESKRDFTTIKEILDSLDRRKAGKIAPPEGLYLANVYYGDEE